MEPISLYPTEGEPQFHLIVSETFKLYRSHSLILMTPCFYFPRSLVSKPPTKESESGVILKLCRRQPQQKGMAKRLRFTPLSLIVLSIKVE